MAPESGLGMEASRAGITERTLLAGCRHLLGKGDCLPAHQLAVVVEGGDVEAALEGDPLDGTGHGRGEVVGLTGSTTWSLADVMISTGRVMVASAGCRAANPSADDKQGPAGRLVGAPSRRVAMSAPMPAMRSRPRPPCPTHVSTSSGWGRVAALMNDAGDLGIGGQPARW